MLRAARTIVGMRWRPARASLAALVLLAAGCSTMPPLHPFGTTDDDGEYVVPERSATVLVGVRDFEAQSDFGSTDEQAAGGLELAWWRPGDALALELAVQHSADEDDLRPTGELEARVTDLSFGLRYLGGQIGPFRTHLGGGLAVLYAETEEHAFAFPREEHEDWSLGTYLHAGIWGPLGEELRLGADVRWVTEEWISGGDLDLDHTQLAVTIGTGF
jgi:hypothetical protein